MVRRCDVGAALLLPCVAPMGEAVLREAVAERLQQAGFAVHEGIGGTEVVGVLANGEGAALLRAGTDALPVREETGLPYASSDSGTDADGRGAGESRLWPRRPMTCLLGAAQLLAGSTDAWHGRLVALFQPAEETGAGAQAMVDADLAWLAG